MTAYEYDAVLVKQTPVSSGIVLFGARASHIAAWGGIPQKRQLGGEEFGETETTGFQRELNPTRLDSLVDFYSETKNVIQNPLLCASRHGPGGSVTFTPAGDAHGPIQHGVVTIVSDELEHRPLRELFHMVRANLETRVEELAGRQVDEARLATLREAAAHLVGRDDLLEDRDIEDDETTSAAEDRDVETVDDVAAVVEDESHILDFWQEIAARELLLEELGDFADDSFLGYSRDALLSFLRPVVVVDGQHRLEGALAAARRLLDEDADCQADVERLIDEGSTADEARESALAARERILPVSLLMSDDPAEHVFQFVIVNQKATPIGRALLGTIVSTTLSNDELRGVSDRLSDAGIALEDSRAIASLTRDPASPFFNLVERGLATEGRHLLSWPVFGGIVRIFRELQGGKLFGERNDYADNWKRLYLPQSQLVSDWGSRGYDSPYSQWRDLTGPWRQVFIRFWQEIRTRLGNTSDAQANNYWGDPRSSNLFNKISLTILASDFFQFLCERARTIDDAEDIPSLVDEWLTGVDTGYFNRNWNLAGVKKDSVGIRNRWAKEWVEYRKVPNRLPNLGNYRNPLAG